MATVKKRENETLESMLHRFKRKVNDQGILSELRKREYYMSKSQKKREKSKAAEQKRRKFERTQAKYSAFRSMFDDKKPIYHDYKPAASESSESK